VADAVDFSTGADSASKRVTPDDDDKVMALLTRDFGGRLGSTLLKMVLRRVPPLD
jgi:hypothetical protein